MAYESLKIGGTATTTLNAANEIAVDAFLNKALGFTNIAKVIEKTLENTSNTTPTNLQDVLHADTQARSVATDWVNHLGFK